MASDEQIKINTLEINFKTMFESNAREHLEIKETLVLMTEKMEKMIEKMDEKYAGKWVEKILVGMGSVVGLTFLGYLATLIYQATVHLN